ncbi:RloB family protein [Olivibacter sitiensis]|uniref:RloB family protein n=1 Tax=Olivibacter sitiensis TaxID=376470 RepID=UPI0004151F50|nr:RloB family protein [Olivibacter sitiensis]
MPKPIKFEYEKKAPFRDAFYFIIICEGKSREPDYFRFFVDISSRVKIVPVESSNDGSSPEKLIGLANTEIRKLDATAGKDRIWFVIDTDRWRKQIRTLRRATATRPQWKVAQSNPCFEVWLYYHARSVPPEGDPKSCGKWKPLLPKVIKGGFNPDFHPAAIETAIENAKKNYAEEGDLPITGATQAWFLAEDLLPLIKKDLDMIKDKFPPPATP